MSASIIAEPVQKRDEFMLDALWERVPNKSAATTARVYRLKDERVKDMHVCVTDVVTDINEDAIHLQWFIGKKRYAFAAMRSSELTSDAVRDAILRSCDEAKSFVGNPGAVFSVATDFSVDEAHSLVQPV